MPPVFLSPLHVQERRGEVGKADFRAEFGSRLPYGREKKLKLGWSSVLIYGHVPPDSSSVGNFLWLID